jgi:hypothetical protein
MNQSKEKKIVGKFKVNGKQVVDATEVVVISINDRDIKKAKKKDPGCCVIASAIKRTFKAEARVHVSRIFIQKPGSDTYERYVVSPRIRDEITAFDRGGEFFTGEYTLHPPPDRLRLGGADRMGKRKKKDKPAKKRIAPRVIMAGVRTGPAQWGP